jgi:hypothetical protein
MQKVQIQHTRGYGDCEDCGGYDWAHLEVTTGGRTIRAHYDGHLGGGCWDGEMADAYLWALAMLGYEVELTGLTDGSTLRLEVPRFFERVEDPNGYRDYQEVVLLPTLPQVLAVPAPMVEPEPWELEDARGAGLPVPIARAFGPDDLYSDCLAPLVLGALREHCELDLQEDIQPYES